MRCPGLTVFSVQYMPTFVSFTKGSGPNIHTAASAPSAAETAQTEEKAGDESFKRGDVATAREHFLKAANLGGQARAHFALGICELYFGNETGAGEALQRAVRI